MKLAEETSCLAQILSANMVINSMLNVEVRLLCFTYRQSSRNECAAATKRDTSLRHHLHSMKFAEQQSLAGATSSVAAQQLYEECRLLLPDRCTMRC